MNENDSHRGPAHLRMIKELHSAKFPNASDDLKQKLNAILASEC